MVPVPVGFGRGLCLKNNGCFVAKIDERLFSQANEFIPERWTTRPEMARDPIAFVPFSTGKYSCVGKQLGLMEIRYYASQIIHRYNVTFAPEQTAQVFIEGKKDGVYSISAGVGTPPTFNLDNQGLSSVNVALVWLHKLDNVQGRGALSL
ncbi:cytochrome p450 [Colletotrichum incanum]|uniref:Cytochrome p450 n=1 Tax=Colletotrichum incanum TaxID=1573173 RepID=A0A166NET8_COLIC|nr:cytochrome p450 [Colletotrichum incanum]